MDDHNDRQFLHKPFSVHLQWVRCGRLACRCRTAGPHQRHGPYYYAFSSSGGKLHKRYLPAAVGKLLLALQQEQRALRASARSCRTFLTTTREVLREVTRW